MTFNAELELVQTIFRNPLQYRWSLQGFGMLRLYLSSAMRLHIWDSEYKTENVSVIHDHPWHFESKVIWGRIQNRLFQEYVNHSDVPDPLLEPYHKSLIRCGEGGGLVDEGKLVMLKQTSFFNMVSGESYRQQAQQLHESAPTDGTVTIIMRQDAGRDREHATVCYPLGTKWVSAEPRPATDEEVLRIVGRSLEYLASL